MGNGQLTEKRQTHPLVNLCLYKGGRKHEASHNKPACVAPVEHGHLFSCYNTGKYQDQAYTKGHTRQGYAFRHKAEHDKHDHGNGHLDLPGPFVCVFLVLSGQIFVFKAVPSDLYGFHHNRIICFFLDFFINIPVCLFQVF